LRGLQGWFLPYCVDENARCPKKRLACMRFPIGDQGSFITLLGYGVGSAIEGP
jgi:hypothetical protein